MVYRPREDSMLLQNSVSQLKLRGKKLLDMGTGTGIIAEEAAGQGAEVTAADIDTEAVQSARNRLGDEAKVFKSDLFDSVDSRFDFITFNPPYLPESPGGSAATTSADGGTRVLHRFLASAPNYLMDGGECIFISSSRNKLDHDKFRSVDSYRTWFEELEVLAASHELLLGLDKSDM